ncbi:DNA cytosine methyltransferase [Neptuniibacter halophilus]|uniref:DNA cytosine methyltransferase n=1 Tax=Neptuniibacter halophilus TaxID=651666 RepID=UPI0025747B5C|nr:DNA cytosine methyltransferase [Neptuniibacter halophilus]
MTAMINPSLLTRVKSYIYTQIQEHRNSKRVWLQGRKLAEAGFVKGATISKHWDAQRCQLTFRLDEKGEKVVSGRANKTTGDVTPIIDLLDKDLAPAGTRLRVTIMKGLVVCTLHHEEQKKWDREQRIMEVMQGKRPMKEGSLCTGVGVSTFGVHQSLKQQGIISQLEWVVDVEQTYLEAAARNNPALNDDTQLIVGSIEEVEPELLSTVDVLSVSLPCTGFSLAGRAKLGLKFGEAHPEAATAVFGLMQIVKQTNPGVILSENVKQAKDSATYHLIISELERLGYTVKETILDGADAGTIEDRTRYFFVAVSNGLSEAFDLDNLPTQERVYDRMADVMDEVPYDSSMWKANDHLNEKAIRDKAAGKGFERQFITAVSTKVGVIGRHYMKGRSTEPFWKREDGMERLMTVSEHAKVKLIPEKLVDGLSATVAHQGLGQSVLLPHITAIMDRVAEGLLKFNRMTLA